jgi:glycosyltransferase involved in cell wall biosynthesis
MVSVTLNSLFLVPGKVGGVEQAFANLFKGFSAVGARSYVVLDPKITGRAYFGEPSGRAEVTFKAWRRGANRFVAEQASSALPGWRSDAVLFPNYSTPLFVNGRLGKTVTIVHDLQYKHFPEYFRRRKRVWLDFSISNTIRKADAIVAISNATRNDLLYYFGARDDKIHVIPNAVSWDRLSSDTCETTPPSNAKPFLLCVSNFFPVKNLHTLLRAFERFCEKNTSHDLILVGQSPDSLDKHSIYQSDLKETLAKKSERTRILGYVSDATLKRLYRDAAAFVFPSLFEGFGLPPVEAIGLGLPTITSDLPPIREALGAAATYVGKPLSVDAWTDALLAVVEAPRAYAPSAEAQSAVRSKFSPAAVASQYVRLIAS